MPSKVWNEITYQFPNYNGATFEVCEWISNFASYFIMYVSTCPCWDDWSQHWLRSTLAQVIACCLTAPSNCLNQYWLIFSKVQWLSVGGNLARDTVHPSITKISFTITCLKFYSNLTGANELNHVSKRAPWFGLSPLLYVSCQSEGPIFTAGHPWYCLSLSSLYLQK